MNRADVGNGVVARRVGLRASLVQQLLGLLLGRLHAIGGGAVGFCDALACASLGLLAQLGRGAFGRLDDARDARRRRLERVSLGPVLVLGAARRLHQAIVDREPAPRRAVGSPIIVAGIVGNSSLRTEPG